MHFTLNCVIFTKHAASYSQKMLIYDALDGRFLSIKLRPKQRNCCVCGDNPSINKLLDYELFCGASATDKVGSHLNKKYWYISPLLSSPSPGVLFYLVSNSIWGSRNGISAHLLSMSPGFHTSLVSYTYVG